MHCAGGCEGRIQMLIKVEQKHIDMGERAGGRSCLVALGMIDAGFPKPSVSERFLAWGDGVSGGMTGGDIETPPSVADFIRSFDQNMHVNPFSFELEVEA